MRPALTIIPWSTRRIQPWKNGGGTTNELASAPVGSGLDDFHWRISVAEVTSAGPFSSFSGVDRTLALLDGSALDLTIAGRAVHLTPAIRLVSFRGDDETVSSLPSGAIRDLNVMTRRAIASHRLRPLAAGAFLAQTSWWAVFGLAERTLIRIDDVSWTLDRNDLAICSHGGAGGQVDQPCWLIEIGAASQLA